MHEVRAARERLRTKRDRMRQDLVGTLNMAGDPGLQGRLVAGSLRAHFRSWLSRMPAQAMTERIVSAVLEARAATPLARLLAGIAVPLITALLGRSDGADGIGPRLRHELGISWERLKDHLEQRRMARREGHPGA